MCKDSIQAKLEQVDFRLPKDFTEAWLKALRSGEYVQGEGSLLSREGYCCLGVACASVGVKDDLIEDSAFIYAHFNTEGFIPKNLISDNSTLALILSGLNDATFTSISVSDYLASDGAKIKFPTPPTKYNWYYKLDFEQIADFIEANVIYV